MEERTILWPFYLILLIAVLITLLTFLRSNLVDDTAYKQKFLSKEIVLVHDSLTFMNGDVNLNLEMFSDNRIALDIG